MHKTIMRQGLTATILLISLALLLNLLLPNRLTMAEEVVVPGRSSYISMDQRLRELDKNSDGMVTVYEVRSFIETRHGKAYQQEVLNELESSASGKSCSTPFAKSLY